jgi:hypothetical protein
MSQTTPARILECGRELLLEIHVGVLEIHAGVCRGHIGARTLAAKDLRQGFYWPIVTNDTVKLVATCEACKFFPTD